LLLLLLTKMMSMETELQNGGALFRTRWFGAVEIGTKIYVEQFRIGTCVLAFLTSNEQNGLGG
jgi:hypothetical protein